MAGLKLSFFNTFQVNLDGQPVTQFRSANNQGLSIYLALNHAQPQPREVLAALFWPDDAEKNARHNLRQALYHLRILLGDSNNAAAPFLLVTRHTVQFNAGSSYILDVEQFLEAVEANDLATAVSHYQGDLLPGFTCDSLEFEDWLRQEREDLHQLALESMFELTQTYLQNGRLDKAQETARKQLRLEPWREAAHRQLMQAYALGGDRALALAQFERCKAVLFDELGIEPAEETAALLAEIESGRIGPISSRVSLPAPERVQTNLPAEITRLIGRELELAQIYELIVLEHQRLVTIVGSGGMGKTRLAVAAGADLLDQFTDGVYLVDLAPLAESQEIIPAIAAALDYQAPDKTLDLAPQLLNMLGQRNLLLILDNFEQLLGGAGVVGDILHACPQITVLVTSRQRLNLASENRYELGGLAYPETMTPEDALDYTAVQLFVSAAMRVQPRFTLNEENVPDVLRICRLVQGMPLGLILAAAWSELLNPVEIALEISSGLEFLAADLADLPPRQRSMQAVFDRSWEMMTGIEQAVLARLSVFRGGFTREAAEEVAGANLRILLALVNKSLLQRQSGSGRFSMHELLRQYAAENRQVIDPDNRALAAHCQFFAHIVPKEVRRALYFYPIFLPQQYAADRENFYRAWDFAVEHGFARELVDLAEGIAIFRIRQGMSPAPIIKQAIHALQKFGILPQSREMMRLRLVEVSALQGYSDPLEVEDRYQKLLPELETYGDLRIRFLIYERMASIYFDIVGTEKEALVWMSKAYQIAEELKDNLLINLTRTNRLWFQVDLGQTDESTRANLLAMLAFFEPDFGNSFLVYGIYWSLLRLDTAEKQFEQALQHGTRALNIAKSWQDLFWITHCVDALAANYLEMDMPHEAGLQQLDALEWHLAIGQDWQVLGYLFSRTAFFSKLIGGDSKSVEILSMVYHHPEANAHFKGMIDQRGRKKFTERIGFEAFAQAWERGKGLDLPTAVAQVRSAFSTYGLSGT